MPKFIFSWPAIFETEVIPEDMTRLEAVAIALSSWACCMAGADNIPESFGRVMAELNSKFDLSHDCDKLVALSKELRGCSMGSSDG